VGSGLSRDSLPLARGERGVSGPELGSEDLGGWSSQTIAWWKPRDRKRKEAAMGIGTILLIVLVLLFIGALPTWSHSSNWGYFPSGGLGLVVLVLLVLVLTGRL
jgi:peptidoglycan/LPS O-acetylase OafA/YrhL